jgi:glutathione S-transferase
MPWVEDAWSGLASAVRLGRGSRVRGPARSRPARPVQPLELWDLEPCPFCRKVREALSELDLEYVCHPVAKGSNNRRRAPDLGGRTTFPILVDPNVGVALRESEDILDHLHATYGTGRARLGRSIAPLNTWNAMLASAVRPRGLVTRGAAAEREQPAERLILYQFEACPFCRKVRETLHALNLDFHVKNVARGSTRRAELRRLGGRVRVPYLVDPNTGAALYESDAIRDYLERTYG